MPTLDELDKAWEGRHYTALAEMADNWLMPTSDFTQVATQEQRRRYQGFWDDLVRANVGSALSVGGNIAGTAGKLVGELARNPMKTVPYNMLAPELQTLPPDIRNKMLKTPDPTLAAVENQARKASKYLLNEASKKKWSPSVGGGFKGFVASAVGATGPYMLAAVMSSAATGSPLGAFGVGFAVEAESKYNELPDDMPEERKRLIAAVSGTASAAIETMQVNQVFKMAGLNDNAIKAIKRAAIEKASSKIAATTAELTGGMFINAVSEGLEEAAQEFVSVFSPLPFGEEVDLDGLTERLLKSFAGGATVGSILSGASIPFQIAADGTILEGGVAPVKMTEEEFEQRAKINDDLIERAKSFDTQEEFVQSIEETSPELMPDAIDVTQRLWDSSRAALKSEQKAKEDAIKVAAAPVETKDTVYGTPPLETKTNAVVEQETAVVSNIAEGSPPAKGVFSPRQDVMSALLQDMGQDIPSVDKQSFAQWANEAIDQGLNDKETATRIAENVIHTKRAMTPQESAGLTLAVKDIYNELQEVNQKITQLEEGPDLSANMASAERLENEHSRLTTAFAEALITSGTERGRALVSQKYAIDQAGNIVQMKARARRNKKAPLTPEENRALETEANEINARKREIEEVQKKDREANAKKVFKSLKKQKKSKATKGQKTLQEKAAEVRQLFKDGCVL